MYALFETANPPKFSAMIVTSWQLNTELSNLTSSVAKFMY